jgi:RNA polymerase sigma factor (sigma-70 family)
MPNESGPTSSIASLAAGTLRGSERSAWKLFEAAWPMLERFVHVRLITRGLPEKLLADCGQEVFTRVWRFRTSYQGATEAEFWRWLRQICDNERRRILRREAARETGSLSNLDPVETGCAPTRKQDDAISTTLLNEELVGLQECLHELESGRRRVIELAYFDPVLPERSIAELLGCSPSNVHRLKVEGLRLLQACLARKGIR